MIALRVWITVQAGDALLHSVPAIVVETSAFEKGEWPEWVVIRHCLSYHISDFTGPASPYRRGQAYPHYGPVLERIRRTFHGPCETKNMECVNQVV